MYRKLCHLSDPPSQKKMASRNNFLISCFEICFETQYIFKRTGGWLEHLLGLHGILLGYSWVTRATSQSQRTPKWAQHACCNKFAKIRQRKISLAPGLEPLTTASPLDNVQEALPLVRSAFPEKEDISEQFSNLLLRYHCFETKYLFKSTGKWLEHLLGLHGILLGCSWVTRATNESQGTLKWAQHACGGKFAIIRQR